MLCQPIPVYFYFEVPSLSERKPVTERCRCFAADAMPDRLLCKLEEVRDEGMASSCTTRALACAQVSIVPRGSAALGFAQYLPSENLLMTTQQMMDMTCMALGGRAAEQVLLGKISTGALSKSKTYAVLVRDLGICAAEQVLLGTMSTGSFP